VKKEEESRRFHLQLGILKKKILSLFRANPNSNPNNNNNPKTHNNKKARPRKMRG
jgi:hypothetical protein